MREQDGERIAAEVLAALRGRRSGRGGSSGRSREIGTGVVPSAGGEASRKRRIPGCPRLRTRAGTGTVRFPDLAGPEFPPGVFHRFTPSA